MKFFSSLRLTVVCLGIGVLLVFFGTIAQVNEGLYDAQSRWFRSFIVWWHPGGGSFGIPIFPGGYLLGFTLLFNLVAAHVSRFQFTWRKLGIHLAHAGIILLLVGQLVTDMLARESDISLSKGQTTRYSESPRRPELVFLTDSVTPGQDDVIAIPQGHLRDGNVIRHEGLPFTVNIKNYYPNSDLRQRGPMVDSGPPPATQGIGPQVVLTPAAESKDPDVRNIPAAIVELFDQRGSLGTWLVSPDIAGAQEISAGGKIWRLAMRWERNYMPYSIQLLDTKYGVYPGTDIPKDYESRIRIENPGKNQEREDTISMNKPLRYEGLTFYQSGMGETMDEAARGSVLAVVHNPGWLTPYVGCGLVAVGLAFQFLLHLTGFISKRRTA